jgi:replicative DNA helicase
MKKWDLNKLTGEQRTAALFRGLEALEEDEEIQRSLPSSRDSEAGFLGCCLARPDIIQEYRSSISPSCFYGVANQTVFQTLLEMDAANEPIGIWTVADKLAATGRLPAEQARPLLMELSDSAASLRMAPTFIANVLEAHQLRSTHLLCKDFATKALDTGATAADCISRLETEIRKLGDTALVYELPSFKADTCHWFSQLDGSEPMPPGMLTGFNGLDVRMEQLDYGDTTVIAARPGVGKTAFALQMAMHAAITQDLHTGFISIEMSRKQVMDRIAANQTGVYVGKFRNAQTVEKMSEYDIQRITRFAGIANDCQTFHPMYPDAIGVDEVGRFARALKHKKGLSCLIIDYIQIMEPGESTRKSMNREQEVSEMSRRLKLLAKNLEIHIIILAQLNRDADKNKPRLSSLRESGSLEQDASNVLFIHADDPEKSEREIIIAKGRHGGLGHFNLNFNGGLQRFEEIESQAPNENRQPYKH